MDVINVARNNYKVRLSEKAINNIKKGEALVKNAIRSNKILYGVTTGFGSFCNKFISSKKVKQLQRNLIMSHATGVGKPFSKEIVRAIMLLRINTISSGNSGVRLGTIQTLIDMLNRGVHPFIPEKGSVGSSGDLVPSAHLVLVMLGMGEAFYKGKLISGSKAMEKANIKPIELEAKEGLALINGTQVMTALGVINVYDSENLLKIADIMAAMSVEGLRGSDRAFNAKVGKLRPHPGQIKSAENLRNLLKKRDNTKVNRIQDPYSLRCIPQVHGASRDTLDYVKKVITIECNSVTDNPLLFPETEECIESGNFHGQPIAFAMDFLGISLSGIGNISERRIDWLVHPKLRDHLPGFLISSGGVNSGFMITQYTAASLVSENKILSHPASVDSIPTSGNQEDHVSMGTSASRKALHIKYNLENILAIEMFCAAQAIDFCKNIKLGKGVKIAYNAVRKKIPFLEKDTIMYPYINLAREIISSAHILNMVEAGIGKLK